ncbi:proteasome-interacting protein cic1 [Dimargaris xerosporica]|nr:proteasome-interacting protein cic1 [Dimargaris xerosporica]
MSVPVNEAQVKQAVAALMAYHEQKSKAGGSKQMLLEEECDLFLQINVRDIRTKAIARPKRIAIPHPYTIGNERVALITKDPQNRYEELVSKVDLGYTIEVFSLNKLKEQLPSFEHQRRFAKAYDIYLADGAVAPHLARRLGKNFMESRKMPAMVNLRADNLGQELKRAIESTHLRIPTGSTFTVKFGKLGLSVAENFDNLMAVVQKAFPSVNGANDMVRSLSITTNSDLALPIYRILEKPTELAEQSDVSDES